MTFWDFLSRHDDLVVIFGVGILVFTTLLILNICEHRETMARIKAGHLDGKKIAEAMKEHLK